jgi:acyl-CoA thioester hydrolase
VIDAETFNVEESERPSSLDAFPVVVRLPIQWGELDAYGHVNNTVYLKWFEAARAVYAARVGVEVIPGTRGVGGILTSVACKYLRPLGFPGVVLVGVRISRMSLGSVTLECRIVDAQTGVPAADANCDVVFHDYAAGRLTPIPDPIRAAVEQLEGKRFTS